MTFLNPPVLYGLGAVAAPVAIHLIHRFRVRPMKWAAMQFLMASVRRAKNRLRMQDLLLLLLRCLAVVAIILAFARPVKQVLGGALPVSTATTTFVVLDNSASMAQSDGVQTRFEQGKKEIGTWIDALPPNSQVALATVSNVVDLLVGKPVAELGGVRRALQVAELSDRGSDLAVGIRSAYEALKPLNGAREIRVYTDSQSSAWNHLDDIVALRQENPGITLTPVVLGQRGEDNLAVTAVDLQGAIPSANQSTRVRATVSNFGGQPVDDVRVTLAVDGEPPSDQKLVSRIEPGASQNADLFARFRTAGAHSVTAAIPPDRLAIDNQRSTGVEVANRVGALLLESNTLGPRAGRDGFFLENALAPLPRERAADNYLQVTSAPFESFQPASLPSYQFVFLCNPGVISPALATALDSYVQEGGNLVVFPGPQSDPVRWQGSPTFWNLLPALVGARRQLPAEKPLKWQSQAFLHPIMALWNEPGQGSLGSVRTTVYLPLQLKPADAKHPGAEAIIKYADGQPAIAERGYGRGRVVLFSSAANPKWTDLPLHPTFVPIVQRMLGYLDRRGNTRLALAPGEVFVVPAPSEYIGTDFSVVRPGAKEGDKKIAGKVELEGEKGIIRYTDTETVGIYRIYLRNDSPFAVFAVQCDPTESDLRQADAQQIAKLSTARSKDPGAFAGAAKAGMTTQDFWTMLLLAAAFFSMAEMFLAHGTSRAQ